MYTVYVLRSLKNGKRYIGMTGHPVQERLREHQSGSTQWTRQNGPFEMVYQEQFPDKTFAQKRERFLKSGHGREYLKRITFPRSSVGRAGDCKRQLAAPTGNRRVTSE